jgi:hypothetical protein
MRRKSATAQEQRLLNRDRDVNDIDPQEFGAMRAQVSALLDSDRLKTQLLEKLATDMSAIRLQLAEAKGGWRMLVWIGGGIGALGTGIGALLHEFLKR